MKQNMVESELMALVDGACGGIAVRDQWSKRCNCSARAIVLCTDSSAALGFVKRKGASRRTRHVDTKICFMQAWALELGQRILKVHGNSQQIADCLTKVMTPQAAHREALGLESEQNLACIDGRRCRISLPTNCCIWCGRHLLLRDQNSWMKELELCYVLFYMCKSGEE